MSFRRPIILFMLSLSLTLPLAAQNYTMNGTPISDCNGTFYDPGGASANYGDNLSLSSTICSDGGSGTHVRLSFSGADLAPGDALCIYDGTDLTAPLLACHTDYTSGQPFLVQATAVNPSGCLTVSMVSDASGTGTGWAAAISCVPSCQTILANLVATNPASIPVDTGWIDICPGERVFFNGMGQYPQNNFAYSQSDLTSIFEWNFGDGGITYGPNTSHRFDQPGGYYVQLFLTDEQGCHNTNLINQRIRVAPKPSFTMTGMLDQTICAGDTISMSASTSGATNQTLLVTPTAASFAVEGSRSDSLALPDGTGIPYETSIFFTEFSPGQVMVSPTDLESICATMEHSWVRDVEISLTCPNGQSIILHDHPGNFGAEVFLGEPNDNDNFNPIPGLGYEYCWINNAPNPTWIEYANTTLNGSGTIPAGNYSTFDPISDLVGCPLNGEWTITVTDWWPIDNGFIFNWSLKFLDQLYPSIEMFSPGLSSWSWNNHPSIFFSTTDSIAAAPQNAGTAGYTFTINDSFGCAWDTLLTVAVLPPTHPDCFSCAADAAVLKDTTICLGESVLLDATALAPPQQEVRFESYPDYPLGNGNHPHNNPYLAPLNVSSLGYSLITVPTQQITSVCLDIETDYDSDLNIFLVAPSGQLLELSTGNGGSGDNYKTTCFQPGAMTPIIGQAAPFNGTYAPEGNWNSLLGAAVNGNWSLRVSDGFAPNQFGKLKWWSIGFNVNNNVSYSWANSSTLSCSTCPNPSASATQSNTYTVSTLDAFGCQHQDTVTINVVSSFPAPGGLAVLSIGGGNMVWGWNAVPGALGYEVSINGGPWQMPNGTLMHTVSGLSLGQNVVIEVRAISPGCTPLIAQADSDYGNCTIVATLNATQAVLCAGDSTGSAMIAVSGGNVPLQYFVDNWPNPFSDGNLQNIFPAGNHSVIARDALGCTDTVYFDIATPLPISLISTKMDVACHGLNTGSAMAIAAGGTGSFNYTWQDCSGIFLQTGPNAIGLAAGCYSVVVADNNSCTSSASIDIIEPEAFSFVGTQSPVACFGGNNGSATMTVSGGTMPFSYLWNNGQTTATASGLTAGFHNLTITDANMCQATASLQVSQPLQLMVGSTDSQPVSCFGGSNGSAMVSMTGGTPLYTYLWDNGQSSQTAMNIPAGPHAVTITDAKGCFVQIVITVSEPFELLASFSNVINDPCANSCQGQAMMQAIGGTSPYTYNWSDPAISPGVQNAIGLCAGTYTVTVQDAHGCTDSQTQVISAAPAILAQFNPVAPTCAGLSDGAIGTVISGGTMPYQYTWENGSNSPDLQNATCGFHYLTITDAAGCTKIDTINVDCPVTVTIDSFEIQAVNCFGGADGAAKALVNGGIGPYSYLWSDPNSQTSQQASNLASGTYTVIVMDANNCPGTASVSIPQAALLTNTISTVNISCFNAPNGSAMAHPSGATPPYSFFWSTGSNSQQISGLMAGNYTVTITDSNQCTNSSTANISQPSQGIQITMMQTQAPCFGESNGAATAMASGGGGGPYVFQWSHGQQGAMASNLSAGTYTVTVSDQTACTATQSIVIQQLQAVMVNVAFVPPTCYGAADGRAAVNLITGGAGMGDTLLYHFIWSVPGAPDALEISGLMGGANYGITVTDLQGCSGSFSFVVSQPPEMVLNATVEAVSCFEGGDGSVQINGILNASLPVTYAWSNAAIGAQVQNLSAGVYTVTVTDSKGCQYQKQFNIQEPPPFELTFQQVPLLCATDSSASISAMVSGGSPDYSYLWSNGADASEINQLGSGTFTLTVTDAQGCTITGVQIIDQPDSLLLSTQVTEPICFGARNGRIKLLVSGGQGPYHYSINGGDFGGSSTFIALNAGIYTVQVQDANGCTTTLTDTMGQPPAIEVLLANDTTIIFGDSLLLFANISNGFGMLHYQWSTALVDTFTCIDPVFCDEIWVKPAFSNTYKLLVIDDNGCVGEGAIHVGVEKPKGVYVPTAFSPNDDQVNDLLVVHGLSRQVRNIVYFRVYDRWGELLYEDQNFPINQLTRGWDGQFRGQPCDPGVYIWLLEAEYIDGYRQTLKGDFILIR